MNPILLVHMSAGMIGLVSGIAATVLRKGTPNHTIAGKVFVVSMLIMGVSACPLALMAGKWTDVLLGIMTVYLVTTGWMTFRVNGSYSRLFIKTAFIVAVSLVLSYVAVEVRAAIIGVRRPDVPVGVGYVFATIVAIAAVGDFRLMRGGVPHGLTRLARHLWRMYFALFIASASFFSGRIEYFSDSLRESGVLILFAFVPLIVMFFWLLKLLVKRLQIRTKFMHWGSRVLKQKIPVGQN